MNIFKSIPIPHYTINYGHKANLCGFFVDSWGIDLIFSLNKSDLSVNIFPNGAIAQLGERLHGMQEVVGSNPIGSIIISSCKQKICEK